jgi:SsrA-binding protein
MKLIQKNKKAYFDYEILETLEVGIVLTGDEVKSLRAGHVNINGTFAHIHGSELFWLGGHISPYSHAFQKPDDDKSKRTRKLLLHKRQLMRLIGDMSKKGLTIIPLQIYFNDKNKVKIELGLAKHKKAAGKKQAIKERDIGRETARELKDVRKYT